MKCKKTGLLRDNALEIVMERDPSDIIEKEVVRRLDFLLSLIKDKEPTHYENYVKKLLKKYKNLKFTAIINEDKLQTFINNFDDYKFLNNNILLATKIVNYSLSQISDLKPNSLQEGKIKIKTGDLFRLFLFPSYYNVETLLETMGRDFGKSFYKHYRTNYLKKYVEKVDFNGLVDLYNQRIKPNQNPSSWVLLHGLISEGKYFYRNENCMWVDVLKEFSDDEIKYLICCYGDYQIATSRYGENIILTMEHTIAEGDPYCSRVLHDTTIDWDLRHPPKEFWDYLEFDE